MREAALDHLRQAVDNRCLHADWLTDPLLDPLRGDAELGALLAEVK